MTKTWNKVPLKTSMHIRILYQEYGWKIRDIKKRYPDLPYSTVSYHAKSTREEDEMIDRRKNNKGRPRKLSQRDLRVLKKKVVELRTFDDPNFTASKLATVSGMDKKCSTRTIYRRMNDMDLRYLRTRQKGLMNENDFKLRLSFARKCIKKVGDELWLNKISFYYDGVSFTHKTNPYSQATAPKSRLWRKKSEGLILTGKGKKEGNNGKSVRVFVAIAYNKGVIMAEQWDNDVHFVGSNYLTFVEEHFPRVLGQSTNPRNKLVLQDGCPVQKSKQAHLAYDKVGCKIFSIPARSPDINPIENMFHIVRKRLAEHAKTNNLYHETYQQFSSRVIETIKSIPIDYINKTIDSLPKRMEMVVKSKGHRIKY